MFLNLNENSHNQETWLEELMFILPQVIGIIVPTINEYSPKYLKILKKQFSASRTKSHLFINTLTRSCNISEIIWRFHKNLEVYHLYQIDSIYTKRPERDKSPREK